VVSQDGLHPPVQLVTIAATPEPGSSSPAVPSAALNVATSGTTLAAWGLSAGMASPAPARAAPGAAPPGRFDHLGTRLAGTGTALPVVPGRRLVNGRLRCQSSRSSGSQPFTTDGAVP
jgi:hypothetical protein